MKNEVERSQNLRQRLFFFNQIKDWGFAFNKQMRHLEAYQKLNISNIISWDTLPWRASSTFCELKMGKVKLPSPIHSTKCCAAVQATYLIASQLFEDNVSTILLPIVIKTWKVSRH